nr:hypothetical protein [Tanacetum cinerariifolium]
MAVQRIEYDVLEFLGVGTTLDIFQNIILLYFQYGVLVFTGYDVLSLFPLWSLTLFDVINSDEDEEDEVHTTTNAKTEDTSVLKSSSPSSLPTELKDLPSKFNQLTEKVKGFKKQVHELEIELREDLKEIPTKREDFTKTITSLTSQVAELKTLQWELSTKLLSLPVQVASVQAKLKTLDALPSLLLNVIKALKNFARVLDSALSKVRNQSVPSAGQAATMPADGEKNTNQETISQFFQRRVEKNAEKENLNNQQPKPIPLIIITTSQMHSPSL